MFNFRCTYCDTELQGEYAHIGERVECPICNNIQILPDPIIPPRTRFQGYKIEELLGMNLLWTTYLAEGKEKLTGQKVILRIPSTFFHKNVSDSQSFYDAVIKAGTLNMKEFPALLDRCLLTGKVYFAFEYLNNFKSIAGLANGQRQIEHHEALTIVKNIAKALANAWSTSLILHKNLSPSNVFIDESCNVKIKNLGIYDFLLKDYTLIKNGFSVWDCRYMSPEFVQSGKSDSPACDIYSLGGILYMLLTGRHPYDGLEPDDILKAPVPSVLEFDPSCSASIANLASKMMAKRIENRISNWDDLISSLDEILLKLPQKRTPTLLNMQIDIKRDTAEVVGLKPSKYSGKKVFTVIKKEEKKDLSNTLAKIVLQNPENIDKNSIKERIGEIPTLRKVSPGAIFVSIIALLLAFFFIFFTLKNSGKKSDLKNISEKNVGSNKTEGKQNSDEVIEKKQAMAEAPSEVKEKQKEKAPRVLSPYEIEEQAIQKLLDEAGKLVLNNPSETAIEEAIKLLHEAKEKALLMKNYRLEQSIINEIFVLEGKKYEPVKKVVKELTTKVDELLAKGDFDTALSLVNSYKGPYEKESEKDRKHLADDIIRAKNQALKRTEEQKFKAGEKLSEIFAKFAPDLIRGDLSGFKLAVSSEIEKDIAPLKDYALSLLEQTDIYIKTPILIRNYLLDNQDKPLEIKFISRPPEKIKNLSVKEDILTFCSEGTSYQVERQANFSQIDPDFILENVLQVAPSVKGNDLLKGLIYLKWGNYEKALESFNSIEYNAGTSVVKLIPEYRAEREFSEILQSCGLNLPIDRTNILKLMAEISKLDIKQEQADKIFPMVQDFKKVNLNTETYSRLRNVVEKLENQCLRADKKNTLLREVIVQKSDKGSLGDALIEAIHNVSSRSIIRLPKGKYTATAKANNVLFLAQKDIFIVGEQGVELEMELEVTGQNIEISDVVFDGNSATFKRTAKNVKIKNCLFLQAEIIVDQAENIIFENCFFRQVFLRNVKGISFDHCTLTTLKMAKAVIPLVVEGDCDFEITDSIIYGDRYAILFAGKGSSTKRKINNSLIFGEEGFAIEKDQDGRMDEKNAIKKHTGLNKYCKIKSAVFVAPQFIDPANGNWTLVPETAGTKIAKGGNDIGVLWQNIGKNLTPQPETKK